MITDSETNKVYFSKVLPMKYPEFAREIQVILGEERIPHGWLGNTLDVWCRDYMPLQVSKDIFLHYHYYPDYLLKYDKYRKCITNSVRVEQELNLKCDYLNLIIDGGNVIKTPDSIIMLDKIFVENNLSKEEVIKELKTKCNVSNIITMPWESKVEEFGHTDGIVRYVGNDTVLLTNYHQFKDTRDLAKKYMEILSTHFKVVTLDFDVEHLDDNSWAYINFLQVGNFILMPVYGIPEDEQAKQQIQVVFPQAKIRTIRANAVTKDGGALNCISWNIKQ